MSEQLPTHTGREIARTPGKRSPWLGRIALVTAGALATGVPAGGYILDKFNTAHTGAVAAGSIACPTGENVVGAWIEPDNASDRGWATVHVSAKPNLATFTAGIPHSRSYRVDVGCGGTQETWLHNDSSPNILAGSALIALTCTDAPGTKNGSCAEAPLVVFAASSAAAVPAFK